jgi:hypothetical protein
MYINYIQENLIFKSFLKKEKQRKHDYNILILLLGTLKSLFKFIPNLFKCSHGMFKTLMFITYYTCCYPHCELTPHTIMCVRHEYKTLSSQVSY